MLSFQNLTYRTPDGRTLLKNFSGELAAGQWITLLGPSGQGKTTFLRILQGDLSPTEGTINKTHKSLLLTQAHLLVNQFSTLDNVLLGDLPEHSWWKTLFALPDTQTQRASALLEKLGLESVTGSLASSLSGGERSRTLIARFLLHPPPILLADEPIAALDKETARTALRFMKEELIKKKNSALLCVLHDRDLALEISDRIWEWKEGQTIPVEVYP